MLSQSQSPFESLPWTVDAFRGFIIGVMGLTAIYLAGLALLGLAAAVNLILNKESISKAFHVYQGYGKVLFALIPQALLVILFLFGSLQAVDTFEESGLPSPPALAGAAEPAVQSIAPVGVMMLHHTVFVLAGAGVVGILTILVSHFRRLVGLPLLKWTRNTEFMAPVMAMLLYVPAGGLVLMLGIGALIGLVHAFAWMTADAISAMAPFLSTTAVPFFLFALAIEQAILFGIFLSLFSIVFCLGLRRTFDSWLGGWYSRGDKLIDRPPPMLQYVRTTGRAAAKILGLAIGSWGLARLGLLVSGSATVAAVSMVAAFLALNVGMFAVGFHKEVYRFLAALTDLWSLHRLYVWTTRTLVVSPPKSTEAKR